MDTVVKERTTMEKTYRLLTLMLYLALIAGMIFAAMDRRKIVAGVEDGTLVCEGEMCIVPGEVLSMLAGYFASVIFMKVLFVLLSLAMLYHRPADKMGIVMLMLAIGLALV